MPLLYCTVKCRCVVGYSGGKELNPTYRTIKDHTEALLVEFDPEVISYEDLVVEWARRHSPVGKRSCQYRSAVWFLNDEQKEICENIVAGLKASKGDGVASSAEPATRFYRAEEYHQEYLGKMMGGGRY